MGPALGVGHRASRQLQDGVEAACRSMLGLCVHVLELSVCVCAAADLRCWGMQLGSCSQRGCGVPGDPPGHEGRGQVSMCPSHVQP